MAGPKGYIHGWIKVGAGAHGLMSNIDRLRERHPGVQMEVGRTGDKTARLSLIRTTEEARGKGRAQAAMHDLTTLADHHGVTLHLSPEPLAGDRKTSAARLAKWYASHGFVHNKGRNKDYAISDAMYRPPQSVAARAAGMITNPGGTERLHQYWVHGPGAAKIRWGSPGDFDRCVLHLGKFIKDPQGYCNLAHHAALGIYPATHAKEIKAGRSAPVADKKPYGDVTYADPKNHKYPIDTEAHCRAAWSYINMPKNAAMYPLNGVTLSEVKDRIRAAMKRIGADVGDSETASDKASASRAELFRSYPLEDYHIIRTGEGDSTGRVVEAYMTVFGEPAEIHDHQGDYEEDIDRAAFNKRIADLERSRNGFASAKVFYNHGMTIHATPSDRYSMPVAVCEGIRAETRGPITRSRYLDTPLGNEVLEMWLSGAVTAQSFTGAIIRSDPQLRRGEKYRPRNGQLQHVRRLELGLKEYGPTPFPAYQGAELVGVRMSPLGTWQAAGDDGERDEALPPNEEAAPGEPPAPDEGEHLARYHQHALYRLKSQEQRERIGLNW